MSETFVETQYVLKEAENCFSDLSDLMWLRMILENPAAPKVAIVDDMKGLTEALSKKK